MSRWSTWEIFTDSTLYTSLRTVCLSYTDKTHPLHRKDGLHLGVDLKCIRHRTDLDFIRFPLIRKPLLFRTWQITLHFFFLSSLSNFETRSLNNTFFELCKPRFVMHPLQYPPLCRSTKNITAAALFLSLHFSSLWRTLSWHYCTLMHFSHLGTQAYCLKHESDEEKRLIVYKPSKPESW
jgi:hypothetical protein